jgi:hypothetical protein
LSAGAASAVDRGGPCPSGREVNAEDSERFAGWLALGGEESGAAVAGFVPPSTMNLCLLDGCGLLGGDDLDVAVEAALHLELAGMDLPSWRAMSM